MFAHRGVHVDATDENTMNAFRRALRSMDGFECDVRLSRDKVPVIVHDSTLARTHNVSARVQDLSARELKALKVPLVQDVVSLFQRTRTKRVVFDLKVSEQFCIDTILSLFHAQDVDASCVVFLVWSKRSFRHTGPFLTLRAVDTQFRLHEGVDGLACKYDASIENERCIESALARGLHVNLYASDANHLASMYARYGTRPHCTLTVRVTVV